jgi:voltage-gated potassium channel Kch
VIPSSLQVAFLETKIDGLFVFNRVIDLAFVGDMVLCFLLPFKTGMESWETDPRKIAMKYMSGWFPVDVISIFPFDLLGILMDSDSSGGEGGSASDLKVLRVVRCLRLIKLIRLLKASANLQKFVRYYGIRNSALTLLKFAVAVVVVTHWLSCLWMLVPKLEAGEENWVTKYYGVSKDDPIFEQKGELYLTSMYWAMMTLTTIGYGDVTASTPGEMLLSTIGMGVGASVYAYIVGAICGVLNNMDPIAVLFNQKMDSLNSLMAETHMPQEMRLDFREFLYRTKVVFKDHAYHEVFEVLSPGLQKTLMGFMHRDWIQKVGLFKTLPQSEKTTFVMRMAMLMELKAFAVGEFIVRKNDRLDALRIVKEGTVHKLVPYSKNTAVSVPTKEACAKKVLEPGSVFGSEIIARGHGFRAPFHVRAITFVVVSELGRDALGSILAHPGLKLTAKQLRSMGFKAVIQDKLVIYCRVFKTLYGAQEDYDKEKHDFVANILKTSSETGELIEPSQKKLVALRKRKEDKVDSSPLAAAAGTLVGAEALHALEKRLNLRIESMEQRILEALLNARNAQGHHHVQNYGAI